MTKSVKLTISGNILKILSQAQRRDDWIELDFPMTPDEQVDVPAGLVEALGVSPRYVGKSRFDYIVELNGEQEVRDLQPDFGRLGAIQTRGVIVTSQSATGQCDFVSRFFAPAAGIDEDPVTGSAHCCLGPFWARRLHKHTFIAHQVSARGGVVRVNLNGDRVHLEGQAVTVLRGELLA